jgi:hypothetical protein
MHHPIKVIEFHVIVAKEDTDDIVDRAKTGRFEIRQSYSTRNGYSRLFVISAEEDEMLVLRLKYGQDKVWIR